MKTVKFILIAFALWFSFPAVGQIVSNAQLLPDTSDKDLFFRINVSTYFKDNDYNTPYTVSYTYPGYFIVPSFEYYITPKTRLSVGLFAQQFFGIDTFKSIPYISIQQKITKNFDLVLGQIYGTLNHGLAEPLYSFDNSIISPMEYGIQLLYRNKGVKSDMWIDWQSLMHFNSLFQENVEAGISNDITIFDISNTKLTLPLQLYFFHLGNFNRGNLPILSTFNSMIGMNLINKQGNLQMSLVPLFLYYRELSATDSVFNSLPYKQGHGFYFKLIFESPSFYFMSGTWLGTRFFAPRGEANFLNISRGYLLTGYPVAKQDHRLEFVVKIAWKFKIDKFVMGRLGTGFYYDIRGYMSSYYGLYFNIGQLFYLKKFNPVE